MQLIQKLKLNSILTAITAIIIFLVLVFGSYEVKKAVSASEITHALLTALFERNTFRSDYLRTNSERAKKQWLAKNGAIDRLLISASDIFPNPGEQKAIRGLISDNQITGKLFTGIVKFRESPKKGGISAGLAKEMEKSMSAQIEMRLYDEVLLIGMLQESAKHRLYLVLISTGLGITGAIALLILAVVINTWSTNRYFVRQIRRLNAGVQAVGGGDLDYRMDISGSDEFAMLSTAVNEMSAQLQKSYQDIEKEIVTRSQAEESLKKARDGLEIRVRQRTEELTRAIEAIEEQSRRTRELNETLEKRVMERTAELKCSNESLHASRLAALNLMEDAMAARKQAEEASRELQQEIATRIRAEEVLREREQLLRLHTENSPLAIVTWDADFIVTRWAGDAEKIFGWSREETVGKPIMNLRIIYEEDIPIVKRTMEKLTDGMSTKVISSNRNYTKDGRVIYCEWYNSVLLNKEGRMTSVMSQVLDVTERRLAEEALRDSKAKLEAVIQSMNDAVFISDVDGNFIEFNEAFATYHKFRNKDECYRSLSQYHDYINVYFADGRLAPLDMWAVPRALRGETTSNAEYMLERKDTGETWWGSYSFAPIRDKNGRIVGSVVASRDITDRKRIEESYKMLAAIVESSDDAIIGKSMDGSITSWNKGAEQIYGYTRDEILGKPISVLAPPGLRDEVMDILKGIKEGTFIEHIETQRVKKDGRLIYVSLSISPILDAEGRITGVSTISRDITDRKKMEESMFNLLAELERSNKDLEQFAYVASHDLQEPLRMVSSFTQLLAKRYQDKLDQDAIDYIDYAVNGANRMQRLINDLLSYSRIGTRGSAPVPVDMNTALGEALANLQVSISQARALVTNDTLPVVMADYTQLVQVFQNLIGNAVKFHGEDPPRIHVSAVEDGNEWKVSVKDNGIGIEPQYFDRIFVIFQRLHTADKYKGTGIGLALCKRIIQRFGGNMWVESEPGKGSTFYFTLKKVA